MILENGMWIVSRGKENTPVHVILVCPYLPWNIGDILGNLSLINSPQAYLRNLTTPALQLSYCICFQDEVTSYIYWNMKEATHYEQHRNIKSWYTTFS